MIPHLAKLLFGLLTAALVTISAQAQNPTGESVATASPIKVLFIGNSYIYYNDLPGILTALGNSSGGPHQIQTSQVTPGGVNLKFLWSVGAAKNAIHNKWDYVILQEAAYSLASNPTQTAEYARLFDMEIKKSGAKTILFLPWAHRGQRDSQPSMDRSLYQIAKDLGAQVAPVGCAWNIAQSLDPKIRLYLLDARHPTLTGSYLAACTLYLASPEF